MKNGSKGCCAVLLGLSLLPAPAGATTNGSEPEPGHWLIRGMALGIFPVDAKSEVVPVGGEADITDIYQPGLDISYFFSPHWALEFQGGPDEVEYRINDFALSGTSIDVGNAKTVAASLTLQYHFRPEATLRPYLGMGVHHVHTRKVEPEPGIPDFEMDDLTSALFNAGIDYRLSRHWFASASLRYLVTPEYRIDIGPLSARVDMDTLVAGAGVGFRF